MRAGAAVEVLGALVTPVDVKSTESATNIPREEFIKLPVDRDLQSVADLRLRSVLCIPIRVHGDIGGVLYVAGQIPMWNGERRFLGTLGQPFAAAVLDVGLPDGSGLELLRWIRAEGGRARSGLGAAAKEEVEDGKVGGRDGRVDRKSVV